MAAMETLSEQFSHPPAVPSPRAGIGGASSIYRFLVYLYGGFPPGSDSLGRSLGELPSPVGYFCSLDLAEFG